MSVLSHLHNNHCAHLNVNAGNICVKANGQIKLIDPTTNKRTVDGSFIFEGVIGGLQAYAPPEFEFEMEEQPYDGRFVDLWGLGTIVY